MRAFMPSRRKRERSGIRADDGPIRCDAHMQWVRGHECLIAAQHKCEGKMEAHHVKVGGSGGAGLKGGDDETVPLCTKAHAELHQRGERTFAARHCLSPLIEVARFCWQQSPAGRRYRARQEAR